MYDWVVPMFKKVLFWGCIWLAVATIGAFLVAHFFFRR